MLKRISIVILLGLFVGGGERLHAQFGAPVRTSGICQMCHGGSPYLFNDQGSEVSPFTGWSHSTMAFSAHDPYQRAKMSVEVAARPGARKLIEKECLTCHAPLGVIEARARKVDYSRRNLETDPAGGEGVSCLVCHRIASSELGTRVGLSGHFETTPGPLTIPAEPRTAHRKR